MELRFVDQSKANAYVKAPLEYIRQSGNAFDICVIDGIFRPQCLVTAINLISDSGVIVLDNSLRSTYADSIRK